MNNKGETSKEIRNLIKFMFGLIHKAIAFIPILISQLYKYIATRLRLSISFKITAIYAGIFTRTLLLLSLSIWGIFIAYSGKTAEDNMMKDFKLTSYYLEETYNLPTKEIEQLAKSENISIALFDTNRKLLFSTNKTEAFYSRQNNRNLSNVNNDFMLLFNGNQLKEDSFSLILNKNIQWNSNNIYIQINNTLSKEVSTSVMLIMILFAVNAIFILLNIHSGSKASKRMLKPVDNMTKTVKNITINALDTRLDISGSQDELKELAETFNNMLDRLEQSYELQNQFVSDASHELRTPISVIQGYVNLLDRWGKNDKAVLEESIEAIKSESESMRNLIENLLFLARGDKNTQSLQLEHFYINELIDEIVKETKLMDNSHEIIKENSDILQINADRRLLKQALRIFIDNSIKYTPEGGKIQINCVPQKQQVLITIEDNGIGISKEDLPNVFNRFYRADKSRTKETGGTGLGLSIAKWIIIKHKGDIQIESKINSGTKISIFIGKVNNL